MIHLHMHPVRLRRRTGHLPELREGQAVWRIVIRIIHSASEGENAQRSKPKLNTLCDER
jgi:hypothetical protein